MTFEHLVRFTSANGTIHYGNVKDIPATGNWEGIEAEVLDGDFESGFQKTGKTGKIHTLLSPIPSTPLFVCIGLNYQQHATEANLAVPKYPVVFTKPADALAGPFEDVPIHKDTQSMLDYEGELTVVIGKDAKNVTKEEAMDYVFGYTSGNDVSARNFQLPNDVSGGQFGYAKSFDKFAPIGPCIASPKVIPNPHKLQLTTKVNGEARQKTETSDMIWSVAQIIAHLSRGTTLRKGTVIQTGTPSGVAFFMEPRQFLKDGDVVEVEIEHIGSIRNKMVFES